MIKKIQTIKNFGVFKSFTSGAQLPDFKEKNIIYGWNYTGKTTLSRIFSSLKNKQIHPNFAEAEFKLQLSDNSEIKQTDLAACTLNVEVFNSEYIRENLKWDTDENVNGISFDVGENVSIREEIEENLKRIENVNGNETVRGKKERFQTIINEFNQFDSSKFTVESRRIKNDIFNSLIEFDKRHFGTIKNSVISNLTSHVITDETELSKVKKTSLATNDRQPIIPSEFESHLEELYDYVKGILATEPTKTDVITVLDNNSDLYHWTKAGIPLHESKSTCSFCDNEISPTRIKELNSYFSNASAKVRESISECRKLIYSEKERLESLIFPSSKNDFFDNIQDDYQTQLDSYQNIRNQYLDYLKHLLAELERKEKDNIFNSLDTVCFDKTVIDQLNKWITDTNLIIKSHNNFLDNFGTEQEAARTKLKKHQVAQFLIQEDYLKKEQNKNFSERCIRRYNCYVQKIVSKNKTFEAQLKSVIAGQQELNDFIKKILNRDDIAIEVTTDDKFILKRGEKIAENLSEGEKTAISFSYFLVSLESLHRDKKLKDIIIFIDDPISSLDGNHIAQIYSIINSFFFRQNEDPEDPNKFVNCFKQLFISTHNFEFFSFLKDSNRINKKNTREYYFVKRLSKDESEIQGLPKSLRDYKSEYIYLFEIIYKFYEGGCQESDDKLILLPNAVRRFLEIYTLLKLPDSSDEIDARLKILMPEPHQLKTLHHFSHFTTFEKVTKHDELLMNLPEAVQELMILLGQDTLHFGSLKKAISTT
ncbi:AAA family ATPase [Cognataquiflexum rubidum]|uniref:AAA family ATPase n=1 Tax=Cognataquiflexum rubidum TaxID=2922273 RepID=UPI001F142AB9|nr:AAA family ATPase [Cognataquiflexum rubidum]MCH6235031.1 AAA family ATPase [Cognataquiflexum rubidum]